MDNTKLKNQPGGEASPLQEVAAKQQETYGSKLDKQTNDHELGLRPGYDEHIHPFAGPATEEVTKTGSGEKLPDEPQTKGQPEVYGGQNQLKDGNATKN